MTALAFLGTGTMGLPMARNLLGLDRHATWMMMAKSFDDVSFRLALSRKDADLVLAAAAEAGIELPVMGAVVRRLRAAEAAGHGDDDMTATYWPSAPPSVRQP